MVRRLISDRCCGCYASLGGGGDEGVVSIMIGVVVGSGGGPVRMIPRILLLAFFRSP